MDNKSPAERAFSHARQARRHILHELMIIRRKPSWFSRMWSKILERIILKKKG